MGRHVRHYKKTNNWLLILTLWLIFLILCVIAILGGIKMGRWM